MTEAKRQWLRKHRPFRFRWINGGRRKYQNTHPILQPIEDVYRWINEFPDVPRLWYEFYTGYTRMTAPKYQAMLRWLERKRANDHQ